LDLVTVLNDVHIFRETRIVQAADHAEIHPTHGDIQSVHPACYQVVPKGHRLPSVSAESEANLLAADATSGCHRKINDVVTGERPYTPHELSVIWQLQQLQIWNAQTLKDKNLWAQPELWQICRETSKC